MSNMKYVLVLVRPEALSQALRSMLNNLGHQVMEASSFEVAAGLYQSSTEMFSVVILSHSLERRKGERRKGDNAFKARESMVGAAGESRFLFITEVEDDVEHALAEGLGIPYLPKNAVSQTLIKETFQKLYQ